MGTKMTKELGVYNEEEKVCTPQGLQRFRLLNNDPRSATLGIKRTPIQVECTPTGLKPTCLRHIESLTRSEESFSRVRRSIGDQKNDVHVSHAEESSHEHDIEDETKNSSVEVDQQYLETDIDQVDFDLVSKTSDPSPIERKKSIFKLHDVRSPTIEVSRTPILVECTPELFALHSRIESLSFCDVDMHEDDPSAVISDDEFSRNNQSVVNNWLFGVENQKIDSFMNSSFVESPRQVAKKQKEINALKKQLFFTPNVKEAPKPKVRTPLGDLQASQLLVSPQKLVRSKQWQNIQEERKRRGLIDIENTPPSLPPLSKISSAPGKILDRKCSRINWDEENTMLI